MQLADEAIARYNGLYSRGMDLLRGRILLDKIPMLPFVMPWDRWRLRRAISQLQRAGEIAPYQWQCHFWIGKAHQRLGEHQIALDAFERARRLVPENATVAKEAANAAMETGRHGLALALLRPAVTAMPEDASLWHNLALALLLLSHAEEASVHIQRAIDLDADSNSQWLAGVIAKVRTGRQRPPATLAEVKRR